MLDTIRRRKLARDAAQYLEDDQATWVTGYWLIELTEDGLVDESNDYIDGPDRTMGSIRGWLRSHGFGSQNRRCGVCAEGALLLAFANDPLIEDDVIAARLIEEFTSDAACVSRRLGYIDDDSEFQGIPELNDGRFSDGEAANLLRQMGNL